MFCNKRLTNTGRVGIGTTAPRALLDVNGDATVSGSLTAGGQIKIGDFNAAPVTIGNGSLYYDNGTNKVYYWNGSHGSDMGGGGTQVFSREPAGSLAPTNITDALNVGAVATASALVHLPGTNNKDAWFNLGTGKVGIGTINPSANLLDVVGTSASVDVVKAFIPSTAEGTAIHGITDGGGNIALQADTLGEATALYIQDSGSISNPTTTLIHTTSAKSGDSIYANMANGTGSFTGNFLNLNKNAVSMFNVDSNGNVSLSGMLKPGGNAANGFYSPLVVEV